MEIKVKTVLVPSDKETSLKGLSFSRDLKVIKKEIGDVKRSTKIDTSKLSRQFTI
jgi:hypothetical protein